MTKYDDFDWKELPKEIQAAATKLGYNKKMWDKDKGEWTYCIGGLCLTKTVCLVGGFRVRILFGLISYVLTQLCL